MFVRNSAPIIILILIPLLTQNYSSTTWETDHNRESKVLATTIGKQIAPRREVNYNSIQVTQ